MKELKVAKEVAEQEFEGWCEENEIDTDTSEMDEEEEKDFLAIKRRIVKAICKGRCTLDGGTIKYTVSRFTDMPDELREVAINRPSARSYTAQEHSRKAGGTARMCSMFSQMTGLADGIFLKMDTIDLNFFSAVLQLFLAD